MRLIPLFQNSCLNERGIFVLNSIRDIAINLDFTMIDDIAKRLAGWIVERGDEPLKFYVVYW